MAASSGSFVRFLSSSRAAFVAGSALVALGLTLGGVSIANGMVRMKRADREVTVRGVAQRDVTANKANWQVHYSQHAYALQVLARLLGEWGVERIHTVDLGVDADVFLPGDDRDGV